MVADCLPGQQPFLPLKGIDPQIIKMSTTNPVVAKVQEVIGEMKETGLWQKHPPSWVNEYQERTIATETDFSEWLQFVYLPNLAQQAQVVVGEKKNFIVPQAIRFFGEDLKKGKLLRLLVELDSM